MNRTVRMLRRTLLCAVFACPLAYFSLRAACAVLCAGTLAGALFLRPAPPLWVKGKREGAALRRALDALSPAVLLCALCQAACRLLLPGALLPFARLLCAIGAALLASSLILRPPRLGKARAAAWLLALAAAGGL